jgi:hypothetical protein
MTQTSRERRIDRLEQAVEQLDVDATAAQPAVEWREAAPEGRPEGVEWDDENVLRYDFWGAQWDVLDELEDGDADLAGAVMGYRSGKSTLGARWVISNAIRFPETRHLAMGVDFSKSTR